MIKRGAAVAHDLGRHGLHDRRACRRKLKDFAFADGLFGNGQQ
jgi:hypothetical protein